MARIRAKATSRKKPVAFGNVSKSKARKILADGTARGKRLTAKQKRALGARIGGK
jgi:hypothetical protein